MNGQTITILTAIIVTTVTIILQKSFSNIICGINLALRKPFKKGDKVTLKYYDREVVSGRITSLRLTKVTIKTYNKNVYIIPTNIVDSCIIMNEDYFQGINHIEKINISLDSNINKAKTLISATVINNANTNNDDTNTHIVVRYNNSIVELQYNVRTNSIEESYDVCSDICEHLIKTFKEQPDIYIV